MSFIKKTVSALLCAVLVVSSVLVFAACGKNNDNNTENSTTKSNNANVTNVTVRYLNFKPEVADVYKKIADEYEKEITIHTTATDKKTGEKMIVAGKDINTHCKNVNQERSYVIPNQRP